MRNKFIRFLKDNHAWDEYVNAFESSTLHDIPLEEYFKAFGAEWWIIDAFNWACDRDFWHPLHLKWKRELA